MRSSVARKSTPPAVHPSNTVFSKSPVTKKITVEITINKTAQPYLCARERSHHHLKKASMPLPYREKTPAVKSAQKL